MNLLKTKKNLGFIQGNIDSKIKKRRKVFNILKFFSHFELDNLKHGTFLSTKQNDYYVYHGFFDKNGKIYGDHIFFRIQLKIN